MKVLIVVGVALTLVSRSGGRRGRPTHARRRGRPERRCSRPTRRRRRSCSSRRMRASATRSALTLTWALGEARPGGRRTSAASATRSPRRAATGTPRLSSSLYPFGSSADADGRHRPGAICGLARFDRAGSSRPARHVIVGNEPNINRFWLPGFGPSGEDVAARRVGSRPARAVVRCAQGRVAHHRGAGRRPRACGRRQTRRPRGRRTRRPSSSSRWAPRIARAAAPRRSWTPSRSTRTCCARTSRRRRPTATRRSRSPTTRSWSASSARRSTGPAQKGSTLPIVYDEFGVESTIASEKAALHRRRGRRRAPRRPGDAGSLLPAGAASSRSASRTSGVPGLLARRRERAPGLAVRRLLRRRHAEVEPRGGQGGGRPRPPQPGRVLGPPGHATPWRALVPPGATEGRGEHVPDLAQVRRDCPYRIRIERATTHATTLSVSGHAIGRVPTTIEFRRTRLRPGSYRITVWAIARANVGPPATVKSPVFLVRSGRRRSRRAC